MISIFFEFIFVVALFVIVFHSQLKFILYEYDYKSNFVKDFKNIRRALYYCFIRTWGSLCGTIKNLFRNLHRKQKGIELIYKCPKNYPEGFKELYDDKENTDFRQMYNWLFCRPKGWLNNIQSHNICLLFLRYFAGLVVVFIISLFILRICEMTNHNNQSNNGNAAKLALNNTDKNAVSVSSQGHSNARSNHCTDDNVVNQETQNSGNNNDESHNTADNNVANKETQNSGNSNDESHNTADDNVANQETQNSGNNNDESHNTADDNESIIAYLIMGNMHDRSDKIHWCTLLVIFIMIMIVGALFMAAITKKFVDEKPRLVFAPKIFYDPKKRAFTVLCQNQDCASLTDIKYFLGVSLIFNNESKRKAFFDNDPDKNMCLFLGALNRNALSIDSMITIHMETLPLPQSEQNSNTNGKVNEDIANLRKLIANLRELLDEDIKILTKEGVSQIDKDEFKEVFDILEANPHLINYYFKDLEKWVDSTIKLALRKKLMPKRDTYKRLLKSIKKEDSEVDYSYEELKDNNNLLTSGHKRRYIQLYPTLKIKTSKDGSNDEFLFTESTSSDQSDNSDKLPDIDKLIRVIIHAKSVTTGTEFIWQKDYTMSDVVCGCANVKDFRDWYDSDLIDMYNGNFDSIIIQRDSCSDCVFSNDCIQCPLKKE